MVKLRYLTKQDFSTVLSWQSGVKEEDLYQWAGESYDYPLTSEQLEKRFDLDKINSSDSGTYLYAIVEGSTDVVIGMVELNVTDKVRGLGSVGKLLIGHIEERGKGYGRKALEALAEEAFMHMSLEQLFLRVFEHNLSGIRCYEKVGFRQVKYERNVYETLEIQWHRYFMALSRDDWQQMREEKHRRVMDRQGIWEINEEQNH